MKDAGCGANDIPALCRLYEAGQIPALIQALRRHRCALMDALHESQSKVDCLDYLLYKIERMEN